MEHNRHRFYVDHLLGEFDGPVNVDTEAVEFLLRGSDEEKREAYNWLMDGIEIIHDVDSKGPGISEINLIEHRLKIGSIVFQKLDDEW